MNISSIWELQSLFYSPQNKPSEYFFAINMSPGILQENPQGTRAYAPCGGKKMGRDLERIFAICNEG
ncbi:MAG TPA: hypothetical protein VIJ46_03400, partial [Rhabdochlamydiaceae bacterium]